MVGLRVHSSQLLHPLFSLYLCNLFNSRWCPQYLLLHFSHHTHSHTQNKALSSQLVYDSFFILMFLFESRICS
uniref:Uncharacterized protein n=1 Tax=Kalanchoe fedtschenkoi TaxID=63787 RepID=A0A7N0UDN4_KALFE